MANKPTPKITINLSSQGKTTVGKIFYGWTVNAGRSIIVGIELIALGALAYRFVIDRKIVDLHDHIKLEESYVAARSSDEIVFRSIQQRLDSIKKTNIETQSKIQVMDNILTAISNGTLYATNLSISQQSIAIDGSAYSIYTLNSFLNSIKSLPSVTSISIDELDTTTNGIKFKVRIETKAPISTAPTG